MTIILPVAASHWCSLLASFVASLANAYLGIPCGKTDTAPYSFKKLEKNKTTVINDFCSRLFLFYWTVRPEF